MKSESKSGKKNEYISISEYKFNEDEKYGCLVWFGCFDFMAYQPL